MNAWLLRRCLAVLALAMLACNDGPPPQDRTDGDQPTTRVRADTTELVLELDDFLFSPGTLRIPAGRPVRLLVRNTGQVPHEFMAGRGVADGAFVEDLFEGVDVRVAERSPGGHEPAGAGGSAGEAADAHGTMVLVEPGREKAVVFTLPTRRRGEWQMACFLAGHYEAGMSGTVTVD